MYKNNQVVGRRQLNYFAIPGLKVPTDVNATQILKSVSFVTKIPIEKVQGKTREQSVSYARHLSMYFLRKLQKMSLKEIGVSLGNRHHTTVMNGIANIKSLKDVYPEVRRDIENINELMS